jgi:hypothetical protein
MLDGFILLFIKLALWIAVIPSAEAEILVNDRLGAVIPSFRQK